MVKASRFRYFFLGLAILFALPAGWGVFSGISSWLSPFIAVNSVLALKSFVLLNAIGFIVLIITFFRRNFFCRYLCPVGCILSNVPSNKNNRGSFSLRKIPQIGIWLSIISIAGALAGYPLFIYFDPVSLFNAFFSAFIKTSFVAAVALSSGLIIIIIIQYFFPGLWCFRVCPLGGLQVLLTEIRLLISGKLRKNQKTDLSRRLLIGTAAGALISLTIPRILKDSRKSVIRPPAALKSDNFWSICTRCGSCIKACPTDILVQDISPDPEFLSPRAEFIKGYCLETCNNCSKVCPSGAITSFEVAAKSQIIMGLAVVKINDCLLTLLKECDRCKAVCPYDAVEIIDKNNNAIVIPEIISSKCVGCGACKVVCPAACIEIVA